MQVRDRGRRRARVRGLVLGRRLAVVNSKFDTGVPPTATQFEVVTVQA